MADFIKECLESMPQKGSIDDFERAFCDVCINPDCQRSRFTDSKWLTRMILQEEALYHPVFADPNDPRYDSLRQTRFEPVDEQTVKYYGGWLDVREDGTVVRHGETPHDEKDAGNVEAALNSLRRGTPQDPESVEDNEDSEETVSEPEVTRDTQSHEPAERAPVDNRKTRSTSRTRPRNTEVPKGGIILGPSKGTIPPTRPPKVNDPWAVDSKGISGGRREGRLTVRVTDGKVVQGD